MGVIVPLFMRMKFKRSPTLHVEKTMLQHQRMGHIREKFLCDLPSNGMVKGIDHCSLYFKFREHYVYGKKIKWDSHLVLQG
jgi:hypothetical protein